jgi:N-glycosylase/DNA lyase
LSSSPSNKALQLSLWAEDPPGDAPARWDDLPAARFDVPPDELSLDFSLNCGQAFRWGRLADGAWAGVVWDRAVWVRRSGRFIELRAWPPLPDPPGWFSGYFRLDVDLRALYARFERAHPYLAEAIRLFPGLRVLGQPPAEVLLSYALSVSNSVPRIARAIEVLSRRFGQHIVTLDGVDYYAFPPAYVLAGLNLPDPELAAVTGAGWRLENLKRVAGALVARGEGWLGGLKGRPYEEVHAELVALPGVGPKIADCVCLFGLGFDEAVPVDTHIWALARELFGAAIPARTLTPATYRLVSRLYRERFGRYAGWAQEYLYHWRRVRLGRAG